MKHSQPNGAGIEAMYRSLPEDGRRSFLNHVISDIPLYDMRDIVIDSYSLDDLSRFYPFEERNALLKRWLSLEE